jgi:hypothetical protein
MNTRNVVRLAVGGAVAGALGLSTIVAQADPPKGRYGGYGYEACKPGNGFGDRNHCHTGPQGKDKDKDKNKDRGPNGGGNRP